MFLTSEDKSFKSKTKNNSYFSIHKFLQMFSLLIPYYTIARFRTLHLRILEQELILVASHFIEKSTFFSRPKDSFDKSKKVDIDAYSNQSIDRFAILLDLWVNEAEFLESKQQLLDCYLESYHHVFDGTERHKLAEVRIIQICFWTIIQLENKGFLQSMIRLQK